MKHKHKYVAEVTDGAVQMKCECGVNIRSIVTDITLIDYEEEPGDPE